MPLGPYKNWNECIAAQRKKGHSENSANRICGEIEKRGKGASELDILVSLHKTGELSLLEIAQHLVAEEKEAQ